MHLYKFDVPATEGEPPRDFPAFLKYLWDKNPGAYTLTLFLDIFHHSRYPICLILLGRLIDTLRISDPSQGIPDNVLHWLIFIPCYLFVAELMHVWLSWIFIYWRPAVRATIRADFLNYTMGHSHSYFQDHFAGSIARKISELSEGTLRLMDIIRNQILFALIVMSCSLTFMAFMNLAFAGVMLVYIFLVTFPLVFRLKQIRKASLNYSNQRSYVTGIVVDTLTNMSAVKSFAGLGYEKRHHDTESDIEKNLARKVIRTMAQIENARRLCIVLFSSLIAFLAFYGWSQEWLTIGQAATMTTFGFSIAGVTWQLGTGIVQLFDEVGSMSDALQTISGPHGIKDKANAATIKIDRGHIEFKNIDFSYGKNSVFKALNVNIAPGEKVALIGPSGAGKTSFISLLLRFYDIQSGGIFIDGHDIADVTQDSLRRNIAVIPQDTALFHRSLMENIRYGLRDATDEQVIEAARRAHAHEFISTLPDGYNTMVGERGIKLSGGQRQRIAIARAILKNAPILVLDEATSALDSESELLIQKALDELMKGKTVIAIAHRLSTIARMDRILVFESGQIIEEGTHHALLEKRGLYARLWSMQSGGFLQEKPQN